MPGLFEGANRTLTALKISYLEQLNSKIFALLSTLFSRLKIDHLIKQIGITNATASLKKKTKRCVNIGRVI
ncbi:hypothetical protein CWC22_012225 [Pseudoalteromonas rubra]|uniref:Uncharacterized protein n=1 Tax=Pseudoalteromonas rubra TaxID=43658 RepID=A0A7S7YWZ4_9GAMM|nr:hypothetical protein CWC22_012225 [Pseudoalteromonas rubra]